MAIDPQQQSNAPPPASGSEASASHLEVALALAAKGYPVFPGCWPDPRGACGCHHKWDTDEKRYVDHQGRDIGKAPLTRHGVDDATLDEDQIRQWWEQWPEANVLLGLQPSGLGMIDPDSDEALAEVRRLGIQATTLRRSRNWAYLVTVPNDCPKISATHLGESGTLDLKAEGYTVVYGRHQTGCAVYLEDIDPAPAPTWFVVMLQQIEEKRAKQAVAFTADPDAAAKGHALWARVRRRFDERIQRTVEEGPDAFVPAPPQDGVVRLRKPDASRSGTDASVISYFIRADLSDDEIYQLYQAMPLGRLGKYAERGDKYLAYTIAKQRAWVAQHFIRLEVGDGISENGNGHGGDVPPPDGPGPHGSGTAEAPTLPRIVVNDRPLRDIIREAHDGLVQANDPPVVFVRAGELVRGRVDEYERGSIEPLTTAALRNRMTDSANYLRRRLEKTTGLVAYTHVSPPRDAVEGLAALEQWAVPPLRGVVEAPTLRPDGSLLVTPGYDAATALLYRRPAGLAVPPVAERPSQADACTALAQITNLVADFPFDGQASRANALGLILTRVIRPAIPDCVPLFIIDKPRAGTGATLLANVGAFIATGRQSTLTALPMREEEVGKTLISLLVAGAAHPTFDNVERTIASESLAALITSVDYSGRLLGGNQILSVPNLATWVATGNNIRLGGDMPRRSVPIRMDAEVARPWTRAEFHYPELREHILAERGALLAASLTVARAWYAADCPPASVPVMGGFETWARTLGGMLAYAGVDEFLGNLTQLWEENDEDGVQWEAFLGAWFTAFADEPRTVAEVAATMEDAEDRQGDLLRETLPDDLADVWHSEKQRSGFRKRLGKALARHVDGVYGAYRLKRDKNDSHTKNVRWRVDRLEAR